ncbi:glycosyltransferase family 2 protein [Namhaeicola litoreus]|uniref:Glycosyltransferase family 2 protein n=1 Tax=Namhaeicola litoreus TaxID=1052145 RepID=A0ABW3Y4N0_9FLAO
METILFSIITVNYNSGNLLEKTLQSVISQDFDNYEYIIIDGGSTDNFNKIIRKYKKHLDVVISEADSGIYDAMNKGISQANGRYINFLNTGDRFFSNNTLSKVFESISTNQHKIISGDFVIENVQGKYQQIKTRQINIPNLKKDFYACHQSIFIDKSLVKPYDLKYKIKADYKWVLEALLETNSQNVIKLDFPIVFYLKDGFSSRNQLLNIKELIRLHKEFFGNFQVVKNIPIYIFRILRSVKDQLIEKLTN